MEHVSASASVANGEAGQVARAEARASASSDGESFVFTQSSASVGERPANGEGFVSPQGDADPGGLAFLPGFAGLDSEAEAASGPASPAAAPEGFHSELAHPVPAPLPLADLVFGFG
jgi:hypothetical protein